MDYISLTWSWMLIRLFKRKSAIKSLLCYRSFQCYIWAAASFLTGRLYHSHRSHRIFLSKIYDKIVYEQMDQKMTWMALMTCKRTSLLCHWVRSTCRYDATFSCSCAVAICMACSDFLMLQQQWLDRRVWLSVWACPTTIEKLWSSYITLNVYC